MSDAITCKGMEFGYDGKAVLRNVNISIPEGDFVCVVGPNGSGKTTLLKLALGLLSPTAGRIEVFGQSPGRSRQRIGYVPQHPQLDPLFPISALEVAMMGRLGCAPPMGGWRRDDKTRARAALNEVGLSERANSHYSTLSGGQKQRLEIARALAIDPSILILDEATSALDPKTEELIDQNIRRRGCTCLIVAHRLSTIRDCDEIIVLDRGKVIERGTHEELAKNKALYYSLISNY